MQFVLLASLLFCTTLLFQCFYLAKQLFSLLTMDNLLLNGFFCLDIQTTDGCNDVILAFICATMSSRSILLMLLINSIYLNKAPQAVSR